MDEDEEPLGRPPEGGRPNAEIADREAAKLAALRRAAAIGFADLENGRCRVVPLDEIRSYIAAIGRRAGRR